VKDFQVKTRRQGKGIRNYRAVREKVFNQHQKGQDPWGRKKARKDGSKRQKYTANQMNSETTTGEYKGIKGKKSSISHLGQGESITKRLICAR